jgi:hypothetical protein
MLNASIAIQPPARMQARKGMYPTVIGTLTVEPADPTVYYFAMAVLLDSEGKPVSNGLCGITTIQGLPLSQTESGETVVFPLVEGSICMTGAFRIRLDIYKVLNKQPQGAELVDQLESEQIGIADSPVPAHSQSAEEQAFIRRLEDAGIKIGSV